MEQGCYGHVVFCDDVRQEIGNKITLVGTYLGELTLFGTFPATLPQLVAAFWLSSPIDNPIKRAKFTLTGSPLGDARQEFDTGEMPENTTHLEGTTRINIMVTHSISPCIILEAGTIIANVETEAGILTIGKLKISAAPPASSPFTRT
jgi:hypothetical protein